MGAKDWKLLHAYSEDWSGCAYWSVFTGRPYRKIHCLFVCFFIADNKWAVFISCDMRWSGFTTSQNTSYPRQPTSQYTVDLSLLVTWNERGVCTAPRGSVDRRGLKRMSVFVTLFLKRDAWQLGLFFVADYHINILPYQHITISTSETGLNLLLTTPIALKHMYVLKSGELIQTCTFNHVNAGSIILVQLTAMWRRNSFFRSLSLSLDDLGNTCYSTWYIVKSFFVFFFCFCFFICWVCLQFFVQVSVPSWPGSSPSPRAQLMKNAWVFKRDTSKYMQHFISRKGSFASR